MLLIPTVVAESSEYVDTTAYSGDYADLITATGYYYDANTGLLTPTQANVNLNLYVSYDLASCGNDHVCSTARVVATGYHCVKWIVTAPGYTPTQHGPFCGTGVVTAVNGQSNDGFTNSCCTATGRLYIDGALWATDSASL